MLNTTVGQSECLRVQLFFFGGVPLHLFPPWILFIFHCTQESGYLSNTMHKFVRYHHRFDATAAPVKWNVIYGSNLYVYILPPAEICEWDFNDAIQMYLPNLVNCLSKWWLLAYFCNIKHVAELMYRALFWPMDILLVDHEVRIQY